MCCSHTFLSAQALPQRRLPHPEGSLPFWGGGLFTLLFLLLALAGPDQDPGGPVLARPHLHGLPLRGESRDREGRTQSPAPVQALPAPLPAPSLGRQSVPPAGAGRVVVGLVHSGLGQRVPLLLSTALPRPWVSGWAPSLLEAELALPALYRAASLRGCGYRGVPAPPGARLQSYCVQTPPNPLSTLAQGFGHSPDPRTRPWPEPLQTSLTLLTARLFSEGGWDHLSL